MRRVVVTGIGFISPIGKTNDEMLENLKKGFCSVDYIKNINTDELKVKIACEIKNYDPLEYFSKKEIKRLDKVNEFAIIAARKAVEDSNLDFSKYKSDRTGVIFSSGIGGINTLEKETLNAAEKGFNKISPFFIPMVITNMSASHIAIDQNIHGHVSCPVAACAGSSNAILDAYRNIKDGYSDIIIAGGTEASINRLGLSGFSSMRALYEKEDIKRASIPFDKDRSGFVMGEGAGAIILEERESAIRRNAKIYGEIIGASISCDAEHITAPNEEGKYVVLAMENAIKEAGIKKEEIEYINAHGTSTYLNDKVETIAIKKTFENLENLKVSSTKSMTGHLLGASGVIELIITLLSMNNDFMPANINYELEDEECDLPIIKDTYYKKYTTAMSNSLGFGGHNVSIIVRRCYEDK